jgi:hypothetical protein
LNSFARLPKSLQSFEMSNAALSEASRLVYVENLNDVFDKRTTKSSGFVPPVEVLMRSLPTQFFIFYGEARSQLFNFIKGSRRFILIYVTTQWTASLTGDTLEKSGNMLSAQRRWRFGDAGRSN